MTLLCPFPRRGHRLFSVRFCRVFRFPLFLEPLFAPELLSPQFCAVVFPDFRIWGST